MSAGPGPDGTVEETEGLEMFTLRSVGIDIGRPMGVSEGLPVTVNSLMFPSGG